MPTPANTTCPSPSWRALKMVSNSAAVWLCILSIVDALPGAGRFEQLVGPDHGEKLVPRLRPVNEPLKILPHAIDRLAVHQFHVVLHVPDHRLVNAVAFVGGASLRQLGKGGNPQKRDFGFHRGP